MSPELKAMLLDLRQHPLFPDLIRSVQAPRLKGYRPRQGASIEDAGAKYCYYSGEMDQHARWLKLLTGDSQPGINEPSDQETL